MHGAGHHYYSKVRSGLQADCTPWRYEIDGINGDPSQGKLHHFTKDGWTAIDFADYSVDTRGGSHSAFVVHQVVSADELLAMAKAEWPEIFARFKFKIYT